jgi:cytochrome d ubiquinol oxidase subunit I
MVFVGSWLSGYFIIATDAWMQHPVGHEVLPGGTIALRSFAALLFNPWTGWQYAHNMNGAVLTGCFVMAGVGAYYLITKQHPEQAKLFLRVAVIVGAISSVVQLFPTGDGQGRMLAKHQPTTLMRWKVSSARSAGRRSSSSASPTWCSRSSTTRSSCPAC